MNKKILIGIIVGLMISTSTVYFIETIEEFEEEEMVKGQFFLVIAIAYIPLAVWMVSKDSPVPYVVVLVGTIGIIILYAVTRTEMATLLGMEIGKIGDLGILSKVLQVGIVIGSSLVLYKFKKEPWVKSQQEVEQ